MQIVKSFQFVKMQSQNILIYSALDDKFFNSNLMKWNSPKFYINFVGRDKYISRKTIVNVKRDYDANFDFEFIILDLFLNDPVWCEIKFPKTKDELINSLIEIIPYIHDFLKINIDYDLGDEKIVETLNYKSEIEKINVKNWYENEYARIVEFFNTYVLIQFKEISEDYYLNATRIKKGRYLY